MSGTIHTNRNASSTTNKVLVRWKVQVQWIYLVVQLKKMNLYIEYLGDGDSSSFKDVVTSKPYEKYCIEPSKNECVGHVQKRLGTRLHNKVKAYKGTKTPLGGKGKLTEKTIDSMQNWYGMAIQHNLENLYQMKKAVGAVLWHCTDFSEDSHRFCPLGINSLCKFQKDKFTGKTTLRIK